MIAPFKFFHGYFIEYTGLPTLTRVFGMGLMSELVDVQPMDGTPTGRIFYLNYTHNNE